MKAPISTTRSNAPYSQEVLRPEDYNLTTEISQLSVFQDINNDWEKDVIEELEPLSKHEPLDLNRVCC